MDDLTSKLNDFLHSPDSMDKIRSVMASLGMDGGDSEGTGTPPAADSGGPEGSSDALQAMLAGLMGAAPKEKEPPPARESPPGPDLSVLMKLAPLMASMNKEDENTALLRALRPYLHGDREKRLDDAIQILRFMRLLPLLQEKGLF